jgi:hypothetical protein
MPQLRRFLIPRRYSVGSRFAAPVLSELGAARAATAFVEHVRDAARIRHCPLPTRPLNADHLHCLSFLAGTHNVPTFFVGAELAEALLNTDAPDEIPATAIGFPFPAIRFQFEANWLPRTENAWTDHLWIGRIPANARFEFPEGIGRELGWIGSDYSIQTHSDPADRLAIVTTMAHRDGLMVFDRFGPWASETVGKFRAATHREAEGTVAFHAEHPLMAMLVDLALNLLCYLNIAKGDVRSDRSKCIRAERIKGSRVVDALWSPNELGRKNQSAPGASHPHARSDQSNPHASPRTHLRRGHWRWQPHGPGSSLRRLTWIEPIVIGEM